MPSEAPGRVRAVLGPTNTGKTHLAIDRMLGHASGMIGFPLRLLARENYDRIVRLKGARSVALITGEEKIVPPNPRWFICTVESMPVDRYVDFLAVDEIQLCADPERGHVFTDRLLRARGAQETMFLGSDTIRGLLQRLVPNAVVETRRRLSTLAYAGPKKLSRLPRRTAVVAFSVAEVYALAELMRRQRGGAAVVLGALSPRTRNAQVAMYQQGEVDFMVATDAIGMGLNMDIDHVAFAGSRKFDGRRPRQLSHAEIGQIAGRAGRHMNDGSFGITNDLPPLDEQTVTAVEEHRFEPLQRIFWRSAALDFASPRALLASLEAPPRRPELIRIRDGEDHQVLARLVQDRALTDRAGDPAAVRLLWEVCQIPDFRKVSPEHHARLLKRVFLALTEQPDLGGRLPDAWVAEQIGRLDVTTGDIDTLTNRIAHVRTWTYISHHGAWLDDAAHWQERTREIEDRLSDSLHERLTQRFVDRRAALVQRRRRAGDKILSAVTRSGEVIVEGELVGRVVGLAFAFEDDSGDGRAFAAAARRAVLQHLPDRVNQLVADDDGSFALSERGQVSWRGVPVARLTKGHSLLAPRLELLRNDLLENGLREAVLGRLAVWLDRYLRKRLRPLFEAANADLSAAGRGLAFQLGERLGTLRRRDVRPLIDALPRQDRRRFAALGLRLGAQAVFFPALTRPMAVRLRMLLWSVRNGASSARDTRDVTADQFLAMLSAAGGQAAASLPVGAADEDTWLAFGYLVIGPRSLRADRTEKLAAALRRQSRHGPFAETPALAGLAGCTGPEFAAVVARLGFRPERRNGETLFAVRRPRTGQDIGGRGKRRRTRPQPSGAAPESPFAALRNLVPTK